MSGTTDLRRGLAAGAALALFAADGLGGDWHQWRGPRRDGVCDERGLLSRWPEGGPRRLWQSAGLGRGYSAPIVAQERIYLAGDVGDELRIFALDLEGRPVWQRANGASWRGSYPGARASCTYDGGDLFHLNAHGRLVCLSADTGDERWAVDVLERFGGRTITWALSESVLVDGPRVLVTAGGSRGLLAALDRRTGATRWASEPLRLGADPRPSHARVAEPAGDFDGASYVSPILLTLGGRRLLAGLSQRHVYGADAETGELLWTLPYPTRYHVLAANPVRTGERELFVAGPDAGGGMLLRLVPEGSGVRAEPVWRTELDTCQGGVVYAEGLLFGAAYRQKRRWLALDAASGRVLHTWTGAAKGAVLFADGRFYCLSEEGEVILLRLTAEACEETGRFRLVSGKRHDVWTHPVIADGRLYLRDHDTLFCFDVRPPVAL